MNSTAIKVYAGIILAIPILAGAYAFTNPLAITGGTDVDSLKVVVYHLSVASLAVGIGMLAAMLMKSAPALGALFLVRGLMDTGDGITGLVTHSAPAGMEVFFVILGIASLFAARYVLRLTEWPK